MNRIIHHSLREEVNISRKLSENKEKALKIAEIITAKKARDIVILDMRKVSGICDYFVICSGDSTTQVKAIYEEARRMCKKNMIKIRSFEIDQSSHWILVDFFDVILHIFLDETRKFYNLEYLWSTAKKIKT